jgi:tetratricopeptide (TPR) repeat protein
MLCPNCKNEKWSDEVCPQCGLDQKAALLTQGDLYQQEGRSLEAAKFYGQYLLLDPDQWDVLRKRAIGLYGAALSSMDKTLFEKADQALALALEKEWDWEQGHQFRVNLFYAFGNLKEIEAIYTQISRGNPARREIAEKNLRIIQLTEQFAKPASEESGAAPKKPTPKWLVPLLLLATPIWLWILVKTLNSDQTDSAPANHDSLLLGAAAVLFGAGVIVLTLLTWRKKIKTENKPKKPELHLPTE